MTRINTMVVPLMVLIATAMVGIVQSASLPSSNDWTNLNYMKQFDLTGSTSHTITTITIKSSTPSYASDTTIPYYFLLSSTDANHLSWTRLTLKPALDSPLASNSDYKGGLRPVLDLIPLGPIDNDPTTHIYSADIPVNVLGTDATTTLTLETTLNHITQPLPKTVKQTQPQLLLWSGDSTIRSPYSTNSGRIKVKCASPKIISFSPSDATKSGSIVTFGPFSNLPAYIPGSTNVPIGKVHFQTDTPQATIVSLERIAEISHWGDAVSITDRILLRNTGAQLRGHFSRIEHQMASFYNKGGSSSSSISSISFHLPSGAKDAWFVDQIGNVSTSKFRSSSADPSIVTSSVGLAVGAGLRGKMSFLELQPRFPLLGGWNYSFSLGYTLPLSSGGWTKRMVQSDDYVTAIPLFTSLKDVAVDNLTTTIVLPEGSNNVQVELPFQVDSVENGIVKTYLDTVGRRAIKVEKKDCSGQHAELIYVKYTLTHRANFIKVAAVTGVTALALVGTAVLQRVDTKIR